MEWSTIPVEILERILVFTEAPRAVVNACKTCKDWNGVGADSHLWKYLYNAISTSRIYDESTVDWKRKVMDLVLVRGNVKNGRCVVRTLAVTQGVRSRVTLIFDNYSVYNDYCLINWMQMEDYGSYCSVSKTDSHFINMVTEEATKSSLQESIFLNHYLASSPSGHYGGANYSRIKVQYFDPKKIPTSFNGNSIPLQLDDAYRQPIKNYCPDSNYIGFYATATRGPAKIRIANGETGAVVYCEDSTAGIVNVQMYDNYLASYANFQLTVVDVLTKKKTKRRVESPVILGFMTHNIVALRTDKIILWNYREKTEVIYPAGEVPLDASIKMIFNDMWLVYRGGPLSFYDTKDGSFIKALALKNCSSDMISLLSDGRLCVAQKSGCRVISFVDSEVTRRIKVEVLDEKGNVTSHEILAYELAKVFTDKVGKGQEMLISRVISYPTKIHQSDEQFVMLFSQDEKNANRPVNETATKLFRTAVQPSCVNTPYQGWEFRKFSIPAADYVVDRVCGKAIIVREKKIDGRWQLVSM